MFQWWLHGFKFLLRSDWLRIRAVSQPYIRQLSFLKSSRRWNRLKYGRLAAQIRYVCGNAHHLVQRSSAPILIGKRWLRARAYRAVPLHGTCVPIRAELSLIHTRLRLLSLVIEALTQLPQLLPPLRFLDLLVNLAPLQNDFCLLQGCRSLRILPSPKLVLVGKELTKIRQAVAVRHHLHKQLRIISHKCQYLCPLVIR